MLARGLWAGAEVAVTLGVVVLLLVVHQLWWTNRQAREGAERKVRALEQEWGSPAAEESEKGDISGGVGRSFPKVRRRGSPKTPTPIRRPGRAPAGTRPTPSSVSPASASSPPSLRASPSEASSTRGTSGTTPGPPSPARPGTSPSPGIATPTASPSATSTGSGTVTRSRSRRARGCTSTWSTPRWRRPPPRHGGDRPHPAQHREALRRLQRARLLPHPHHLHARVHLHLPARRLGEAEVRATPPELAAVVYNGWRVRGPIRTI